MNSSIKKITYDNPPKYDLPEKYRDYIAKNCNYSCVYCSLMESENLGATFNIDHFKPKVLFPSLFADCENLRYSCPRCNSYKRAKWISEEDGCSRKCDSCINKVCKTDIPRFVDCLNEDPDDYFFVSSDYKILGKNNSKVAQYTIDALRLNRLQLVKMRRVRDELNKLRFDIKSIKNNLKTRRAKVSSSKANFDEYKENSRGNDDLIGAIEILFEMIILHIEQEETYLDHLEKRIDKLIKKIGRAHV